MLFQERADFILVSAFLLLLLLNFRFKFAGCDLVGFHIEDYCRNFLDCCARRLGCKVDRRNKLVEFCGRTVRVRTLPIGIPYDRFVQMANDAPRVVKAEGASQIILGVDRLDYTKGIVHRYCLRQFFPKNMF